MRKEKRHIWQAILGILSLAVILYLIIAYPPSFILILPVLALLGVCLFFISRFILKDTIQAALISSTAIFYLLVRSLGLKDIIFAILFLILFVTLELFFKRS